MEPLDTCLDLSGAVQQFWSSPDQALFPQTALVAVTGLSNAHFERARWQGDGPKFIKLGRLVRYRKADVLAWLDTRPAVSSTTEATAKFGPQFGSPRGPCKQRARPATTPSGRPAPNSGKRQPIEPRKAEPRESREGAEQAAAQ